MQFSGLFPFSEIANDMQKRAEPLAAFILHM